jgi:hypothetical protein
MHIYRFQKMLASTMQFSRYGRNHASRPPIREALSAGRSSQRPSKAAASSGPNSVLGVLPSAGPRSAAPRGESVLTGLLEKGNRIASAPLESMDAQSRIR